MSKSHNLKNSPPTRIEGYSLIEVLLVTALLALVIVAAFGFWQFFSDSYSFSLNQSRAVEEASRTSTQLAREIREAYEGEDGSYTLGTVGDQELIFYADLDGDGLNERVRYWLDGTELKKGVVEASGDPYEYQLDTESEKVVSDSIVNGVDPLFYYYNGDWPGDVINNPLTLAGRQLETRHIKVNIIVSAGDDTDPTIITVTNGVTIRSLKSNL